VSQRHCGRKPERRLNIKPAEAKSGDRHRLTFNYPMQPIMFPHRNWTS